MDVHSETKRRPAPKFASPLLCQECEKTFSTNGNLTKHIMHVHGEVQMLECDHCSYKSKYKRSLTSHKENLHGPIKFNFRQTH